jgi:hypothetical protein
MTEVFIAGGVVLLIAFVHKFNSLTFAHFEWKLVELKFAEPHKSKKPIKAKALRAVRAPRAPGQLKSVKRVPRGV